jgi:hypothetical protein
MGVEQVKGPFGSSSRVYIATFGRLSAKNGSVRPWRNCVVTILSKELPACACRGHQASSPDNAVETFKRSLTTSAGIVSWLLKAKGKREPKSLQIAYNHLPTDGLH